MDWKKVERCLHEWGEYEDSGTCVGAEGCRWSERRCIHCRVYHVDCLCGYERGASGEPRKRQIKRQQAITASR